MTALPDHVRLAIAWAENTAAAQVRACKTSNALCDWIVKNRGHIAELDRSAPGPRAALQLIINHRFAELDG
jgi:hypothetical protein